MARTINNSRNRIRSNRKKLDNNGKHMWRPWAALDSEILIMVLMKIGLIDFLSFSGVCRSWRVKCSFPQEHLHGWPLMVIKSLYAMKACSLLDLFSRGRQYKTLLPGVSGQSCVGLSCGYLIMLRRNYAELSIINPITRHELHFPAMSDHRLPLPMADFRATVVYSSSLSTFIMIVAGADYKSLLLSRSDGSKWVVFRCSDKLCDIVDLTFFKGKIYVLNRDGSLGELRLKPVISLKLLNIKSIIPSSGLVHRQLVTSSECLFMVDPVSLREDGMDLER